jgi:WD40 repeat protein
MVRVWDLRTDRSLATFDTTRGPVKWMHASRDGGEVLVAGDDGFLRSWDVAKGAEVRTLPTSVGAKIRCGAISRDGSMVALGFSSGDVRILDLSTGAVSFRADVSPAVAVSLAFNEGEQTLIIGLANKPGQPDAIEVRDLLSGKSVRQLIGHAGAVWGVAPLDDGRRLLSVSSDRTLRIWNLEAGSEQAHHDDHPGAARLLAVTPGGRYAVVGTGGVWAGGWTPAPSYGVYVWDVAHDEPVGRFESASPVSALAVSPDGTQLAWAGEDGVVYLQDLPASDAPRNIDRPGLISGRHNREPASRGG